MRRILRNMTNIENRSLAAAATLSLLASAWLSMLFIRSASGFFPLDDAYIILEYARNFLHTRQLAFNPGIASSGITSALTAVLVSIAAPLAGDWHAAGLLVGVLGWGLAGWAGWALARRFLDAPAAWAFAILYPLSGRFLFYSLSGMDTMPFCALAGWSAYFLFAGRPLACGALLGALWLARPEAVFFLPVAGAWALLHWPGALRSRVRSAGAMLALAGAVAAPWILFCLVDNGTPFPATVSAKAAVVHCAHLRAPLQPAEALREAASFWMLRTTALDYAADFRPIVGESGLNIVMSWVPLLPAALLALACSGRRGVRTAWPLAAVLILHFAAMAANGSFASHNWGRYYVFNQFSLFLCGAWALSRPFGAARRRIRLAGAAPMALACALLAGDALWASRVYGASAEHYARLDGAVGVWLARNTPPDAVVGLHNAGYVKWFGGRKVVDFAGLVTTGMHEKLEKDGFLRTVHDTGVTHFAYHGDDFPRNYGLPRMSQSPYFERTSAPGRGVYVVRRDLLARRFGPGKEAER